MLLIKGNYFLKGLIKSLNTVLQTCYALFTHLFVQLCCKYNVEVVLCYSGAIFAAVCNDFSQVVFSHSVFCPFCLSITVLSAFIGEKNVAIVYTVVINKRKPS